MSLYAERPFGLRRAAESCYAVRMKTLRRIATRAVIAVVIALSVCEVGLRVMAANATAAQPQTVIQYSYHYAHSPYWSDAFAHGFHRVFSKGVPNPDNQISLGTVSVPGYTIVNNERLTTDQPTTYTKTVWLFGSSSVWGAYVADGWTIASYLQREFNRRGIPWRVRNMAEPGINITLEYYWLTQSDVQPGDLVIFIDGGVDMYYTVDDAFKQWKADSAACKLQGATGLALATLWCNQQQFIDTPQDYIDSAIASDFPHYWRDVDKARAWTAKHGAEFVHYMQPTTYDSWAALYAKLGRGDVLLTVDRAYHYDDLHYDDAGHAALAAQIAGRLTFCDTIMDDLPG